MTQSVFTGRTFGIIQSHQNPHTQPYSEVCGIGRGTAINLCVMGKNSKKLSKIRRKSRRSGERLFQELLRVQPNACIEDYYQNGQWQVDILQIDRELIEVHRCECRARLGKGVPVPPCQSGGGKGWQGDGWHGDRSRSPAPRSKDLPHPWEEQWSDEYETPYFWNALAGEPLWKEPVPVGPAPSASAPGTEPIITTNSEKDKKDKKEYRPSIEIVSPHAPGRIAPLPYGKVEPRIPVTLAPPAALGSGVVTGAKTEPKKEKKDRKLAPRGSVARASKPKPSCAPPAPQGQLIYQRWCLNCGAEAEQNHRFCPFCGYQLHMIRGEVEEEHGEDFVCSPELLSGFEIGDAVEFDMQLGAKEQPRATSVSSW